MRHSPVAVVLTCFNLGRTLPEALASVRGQTRPATELLVVDDGSDDLFTRQLLLREAASGCRVVRTANRGVSAARNTGIPLTSSDYVVVLDADDCLAPPYLETLARHLDEHPDIDFVSCGMRSFGDASGTWVPPAPSIVNGLAFGALHVSSMFRRRVWEEAGGFDEDLEAYEDLDFWTTALELGFRGAVLPEPLLLYRIRPGSRIHGAWQRERHRATMGRIYAKHQGSVTRNAEPLLLAKEEFLLQQRAHQEHLEGERQRLERELREVHGALADATGELAALGGSRVEMGELRRLEPVSMVWGTDRGRPVDRHYIEGFLEAHRADIRGRVLEVKDAGYTRLFGDDRVVQSDVLDVNALNEDATVVADLARADRIPDDTYDTFILTQTLGLIYDVRAALRHAWRVLSPGGVLLCTLPAAGRLSYEDAGADGDYWRFTEASVRALFAEVCPLDAFEVTGFGNVLATSAFLFGLADHELRRDELDRVDPSFPLVYAVRAVKPLAAQQPRSENDSAQFRRRAPRAEAANGLILLYHRLSADPAESDWLSVPLDVFRAQMAVLRERYEVLGLAELSDAVRGRKLSGRAVAVTFDDAYEGTSHLAAETLVGLRLAATIFATSRGLEGPCEFWWDRLERVLAGAGLVPGDLAIDVAGRPFRLPTATPAERRDACTQVREALHRATPDQCEATVAAMEAWAGVAPPARASRRPLDMSGLQRLADTPGITIGGHGAGHACLPLLPEEQRRREVVENKARLEKAIGRRLTTFAYPYGQWDGATVRAVREAGYEVAVTVDAQPVRNGAARLLLPRYEVPGALVGAAFAEWLDQRLTGR